MEACERRGPILSRAWGSSDLATYDDGAADGPWEQQPCVRAPGGAARPDERRLLGGLGRASPGTPTFTTGPSLSHGFTDTRLTPTVTKGKTNLAAQSERRK
jgi:hypothetical protein